MHIIKNKYSIKFVQNHCFFAGKTHICHSEGFFEGAKPFLTPLGKFIAAIRLIFLDFILFLLFFDLFFLLFSSYSAIFLFLLIHLSHSSLLISSYSSRTFLPLPILVFLYLNYLLYFRHAY
jgi:hypothetical protein